MPYGVDYNGPRLPTRLQWGRAGLKYLGVSLGREESKRSELGVWAELGGTGRA